VNPSQPKRSTRGKTALGMLNRFGDFFLGSIAKVASLATFVLNEIAPYKKDFEVVSATTQNIGLLGPSLPLSEALSL